MIQISVEMGDVIAMASRGCILLFEDNNLFYYVLQLKAIVSHTLLQSTAVSGQVWIISHQRKLSNKI